MAISFNDVNGEAKKGKVNYYTFEEGMNKFRMVGDILPRYVYWVQSNNGRNLPIECLSFDREAEAFLDLDKDWVKEYFPGEKCSWSYSCLAIDPKKPNEIKVLSLKKGVWKEIRTVAKSIGDPTDMDTGWNALVNKEKTGPNNWDVEYSLDQLACAAADNSYALTDEQKELVAAHKPIDEVFPRPTVDEQHEFIKKFFLGEDNQKEEDVPAEVSDAFDEDILI